MGQTAVSKAVVIPDREDPEEFEALVEELGDEWRPEVPTENFLVSEIAIAGWKLRRVQVGEIRSRIMASEKVPDLAGDAAKEVIHLGVNPESGSLLERCKKMLRVIRFAEDGPRARDSLIL